MASIGCNLYSQSAGESSNSIYWADSLSVTSSAELLPRLSTLRLIFMNSSLLTRSAVSLLRVIVKVAFIAENVRSEGHEFAIVLSIRVTKTVLRRECPDS
jgi:hypothetical protein